MSFNPKFKDFLEKKPDISMIGLAWSIYWRFTLLVLAIEAIIFIVVGAIVLLLPFHATLR